MLITKRILTIMALCLIPALAGLSAISGSKTLFLAEEKRPSDAIVLFHGSDLSEWIYVDSGKPADWRVTNGYMEVRGGSIRTKQEFGDCQLHVEFWLPLMPNARGQARSNSGVYLQGRYEVQVLDSYSLDSQDNDCGAIYKVSAPLVNACRPPKHWQSYDVIFHAPRFDDQGNMISKARLTVLQNGVLIQDNVEVAEVTTAGKQGDQRVPGPIMLQDHGNAVRYRNVWVRPL